MWPLIAAVAASAIGGAMSSKASKSAANTQAAASDRAADLQNQQFEKLLALQMPSYTRAEGAAGVYGRALGLPGMTAQQPQQPQQPQTYQPQPSMTGGGYSAPAYNGRQGGTYAQMQRMIQAGQLEGDPVGGAAAAQYGQAQPVPENTTQATPSQGGGQQDIAAQVMGTPGYQTQLDQGLKAIDRAAPLVGGMYSGRRMKALESHGQNTFGSYYNDWMNRVGGIAGQAPQIAQNVGQAGMQNANNVGNLMMTGANARAQGTLNSASAWTGALGNMAGMAGGYWG